MRSRAGLRWLFGLNISVCIYRSLRLLYQEFKYTGFALRSRALVCNIMEHREFEESLPGILIVMWLACSIMISGTQLYLDKLVSLTPHRTERGLTRVTWP
jgi:hypothetical protein